MTRLVLLALACSDLDGYSVHAPAFFGDCGRVPIEDYTAGEECIRLEDTSGTALFRLATSESCGGPPCLTLQPGETGLVLEKVKPGPAAEWTAERGPCDELAQCCGYYPETEWQCW